MEPSELAVEFVSDEAHPPPAPAPVRPGRRWTFWVFAVAALVIFGVVHGGVDNRPVPGHGQVAVPTYTPIRPAPGVPYLAAWHYGLPMAQLYGHGADPDFLEVARGSGQQLQVVSMGSRGCPTIVTTIREPSSNLVIVEEDQTGSQAGCYLGVVPITNVLVLPALDPAAAITVMTGRTTVVLPAP